LDKTENAGGRRSQTRRDWRHIKAKNLCLRCNHGEKEQKVSGAQKEVNYTIGRLATLAAFFSIKPSYFYFHVNSTVFNILTKLNS